MSLVFAFVLAFPSSAAGTDPESRLQARFTELMAGLFHNGADIEVYNADNVDITDSFRAQFASDADSGNYQAMYDYLSSIEATVVKTSNNPFRLTVPAVPLLLSRYTPKIAIKVAPMTGTETLSLKKRIITVVTTTG